MTEQELIQENQKLNARLQKAVSVFGEQKATIERLTAERDAAIAKTAEAQEQDQLFFEQQQEIEQLKASAEQQQSEYEGLKNDYATLDASMKALEKEKETLATRLEKAATEFSKQKEVISVLQKRNEMTIAFISKIQDDCMNTLQEMK